MKRNQFLWHSLGAIWIAPSILRSIRNDPKEPLDKDLVREFVGKAHTDKDKVMALLNENPTLLNSAHDWGNGDFETALGAASHVGYKELVHILVDHGAQTNIFTACLMGQLEIVKLMLERFPASLNARGPHGYTPLHHAIKGEDGAAEVKSLLESLGARETRIMMY